MNGTFFMESSFVIASIISIKIKYFQEYYVTFQEINVIKEKLHKVYRDNNIGVVITDSIDKSCFDLGEVIVFNKKNDIDLYDIEYRYKSYYPSKDIYNVLWDEELILNYVVELKERNLNKVKKLIKEKKGDNCD